MTKFKMAEAFQRVNDQSKKAFTAYIMAGDGGLHTLKDTILLLEQSGVTVIELGIPFSDPVADGPVIQEAGQRALKEKVTLTEILHELASFKEEIQVPIVIMTYANPVFKIGAGRFADLCDTAGVSGVIIPDVPMEEEAEFKEPLANHNIAMIRFVTLTSSSERIAETVKDAEGFIYAVTVNGITGARAGFAGDLNAHLSRIAEQSPVPVLAGFGVSSKEQAETLGAACGGVIVGSKIVQLLHEGKGSEIKQLIP
ncbi:tryptophan synthase subunit alpha [Domibacillus enclensis]|uniref:Tryptophan synthase alpha chain n=1 Tax=Domibacillus enclensis TaxID=1017273 RepID=A0A1N6NPI3_9BACI|nr:tryptophan synthase subunit alpha [Domibacillus enclensis]OXS80104.1 tryptophan synthase subunit alpha [Domibacillus enclensis]SIP93886.1 tryptophan synthase, alpha chain [Domibacillus enclensis]